MKISTKGKYAVEGLVYMAYFSRDIPLRAKVIAEALGTTEKYLEQIFFMLRKEGVLETVRGAKGGYLIKMPLSKLSVGKIIRSVEKDMIPVPCIQDEMACTCEIEGVCTTRKLWQGMSKVIDETLDAVTLDRLRLAYRETLIRQYGEPEYYL